MATPESIADVSHINLDGQTVLVTGSTSGIGRETALALGRLGARVLVHGRNEQRGNEVVETLRGEIRTGASLYTADFSDLQQVEQFAKQVRRGGDRLDLLVNNAGGYFSGKEPLEDGLEFSFVVNHLAPYVLTAKLLPKLREGTTPSQIINVASSAHKLIQNPLNLEAVTSGEKASWSTYCRSKLANIQFTKALSRRLDHDSVVTHCLHPGVIPESGFFRHTPLPSWLVTFIVRSLPVGKSVPEGAATSTFVAATELDASTSGHYYSDCSVETPTEYARDTGQQEDLWLRSEELTGVSYPFN